MKFKVLLVAKPWRGGLAYYMERTLKDVFPALSVEWIPTYPVTSRDRALYRLDKERWKLTLTKRIHCSKYDLAIFINHIPGLPPEQNVNKNVLWLTDDPRTTSCDLNAYGRVFISDPGYESEIVAGVGEKRYAGVLPFACCPQIHLKRPDSERKSSLCFIANRDEKRSDFLRSLLFSKIHFINYGNYFLKDSLFWSNPTRFRPRVSFAKMVDVYRQYAVSLNIHAGVVRHGTNMRTFECAAYGIPQLVEYRPGLENYFDLEREVLVFNNAEELQEKAIILLKDKDLQNRISKNAMEHVLKNHTYQNRVKTILSSVDMLCENY